MAKFQADTTQMRGIGSRLSAVVDALNDEAHSNFDTGALGMGQAVGGLSDFVSGWSHGRGQISSSVKDAQGSLNGSSNNYDSADGDAKDAFSGGQR